ncbi:MAG: PadR family transcriptional regulator [Pseudomonadota bacterium]
MTTRLLILWLLSEHPRHGYQIKSILTDPGLAFWFPIEDASIYAMLRSLTKQGLARVAGEERVGKRPSRTLYKITPQGRAALAAELANAWGGVTENGRPIHAVLAARDEFEPYELCDGLKARLSALSARRERLDVLSLRAPSPFLARREAALLDAEIAWAEQEIADLTTTNVGARP